MKRLFQRRFPVYLTGFILGVAAVFLLMRAKKALAPDFADALDRRAPVTITAGGSLRLQLGEEPGRWIAWGFPTRLALGREIGGRTESVIALEYRDLVEKETLLGPLRQAGAYQLIAHFYVCAYPGEKYCARIVLEQPVQVTEAPGAPRESALPVDLKKAADAAAAAGAERAKAQGQALPTP